MYQHHCQLADLDALAEVDKSRKPIAKIDMIGTPTYLSPELNKCILRYKTDPVSALKKYRSLDLKANDIYALGVSLLDIYNIPTQKTYLNVKKKITTANRIDELKDKNLKNLGMQMTDPNPENRISIENIKNHKYFTADKDFSFSELEKEFSNGIVYGDYYQNETPMPNDSFYLLEPTLKQVHISVNDLDNQLSLMNSLPNKTENLYERSAILCNAKTSLDNIKQALNNPELKSYHYDLKNLRSGVRSEMHHYYRMTNKNKPRPKVALSAIELVTQVRNAVNAYIIINKLDCKSLTMSGIFNFHGTRGKNRAENLLQNIEVILTQQKSEAEKANAIKTEILKTLSRKNFGNSKRSFNTILRRELGWADRKPARLRPRKLKRNIEIDDQAAVAHSDPLQDELRYWTGA